MCKKESLLELAAERELVDIESRFIEKATISDLEEIIAQTVDVAKYSQHHTNILFHFKAASSCNLEDSGLHAVKFHNNMTSLYLKYNDDAIQEELESWKQTQREER